MEGRSLSPLLDTSCRVLKAPTVEVPFGACSASFSGAITKTTKSEDLGPAGLATFSTQIHSHIYIYTNTYKP